MKTILVVCIVSLCCGLSQSYPAFAPKRYQRANTGIVAPVLPIYSNIPPQYYDRMNSNNYGQQQQPDYQQQQYLSMSPSHPQRMEDYGSNKNNYYYYYPRQEDYEREPLYGVPTYRGEYKTPASPYLFAEPSYTSDDEDNQIEITNPLDYLHEEINHENKERSRNQNVAFMQNLAMYNKVLDSLPKNLQQPQQRQQEEPQDTYNSNEYEDYEMDEPAEQWYDQTSIQSDDSYDNSYNKINNNNNNNNINNNNNNNNNYNNYNNDYQLPQSMSYQSDTTPELLPIDYDQEVRELKDLTKQKHNGNHNTQSHTNHQNNKHWQQDLTHSNIYDHETEYVDDDWINWERKRAIQPKKDYGFVEYLKPKTENSKHDDKPKQLKAEKSDKSATAKAIVLKVDNLNKVILHSGQKEVVLPRPATPVRRPFTEPIMQMMKNNNVEMKSKKSQAPPAIYSTIKQIIDMKQNLSHVSKASNNLKFIIIIIFPDH